MPKLISNRSDANSFCKYSFREPTVCHEFAVIAHHTLTFPMYTSSSGIQQYHTTDISTTFHHRHGVIAGHDVRLARLWLAAILSITACNINTCCVYAWSMHVGSWRSSDRTATTRKENQTGTADWLRGEIITLYMIVGWFGSTQRDWFDVGLV